MDELHKKRQRTDNVRFLSTLDPQLFLSVISWWNFFCSTRTLANSLEAALTIVALYYWPFTLSQTATGSTTPSSFPLATSPKNAEPGSKDKVSPRGDLKVALFIASLTCIFRPTAAILWIFLGMSLLASDLVKGNLKGIAVTILSVILIG